MNKREGTIEEICESAFGTTGQSQNNERMAQPYEKLTSSNFGGAIIVMRNPESSNDQLLRDELYAPNNLGDAPAIRWGLDTRAGGARCVSEQEGKYREANLGLDVPKQHHR